MLTAKGALAEAERAFEPGYTDILEYQLIGEILAVLELLSYTLYLEKNPEDEMVFQYYAYEVRYAYTRIKQLTLRLSKRELAELLSFENFKELFEVLPYVLEELVVELIVHLRLFFQAEYIGVLIEMWNKWREDAFWEKERLSPNQFFKGT